MENVLCVYYKNSEDYQIMKFTPTILQVNPYFWAQKKQTVFSFYPNKLFRNNSFLQLSFLKLDWLAVGQIIYFKAERCCDGHDFFLGLHSAI